MTPQEMKNDMSAWQAELGLNKTPEYQIDPEELSAVIESGLDNVPIEELEKLILKISSYNLFLKREKGRLTSRLIYLQNELNKSVYSEVRNLGVEHKYKKIEEKIAFVKETNPAIQDLSGKVLLAEIKVNQIKDLPAGIDTKLDILKTIYKRKINEPTKHQPGIGTSSPSASNAKPQ